MFSKRTLERKDFQEITRLPWAQEAPGSNPGAPTKEIQRIFSTFIESVLHSKHRCGSLDDRRSGFATHLSEGDAYPRIALESRKKRGPFGREGVRRLLETAGRAVRATSLLDGNLLYDFPNDLLLCRESISSINSSMRSLQRGISFLSTSHTMTALQVAPTAPWSSA